MTIGYNPMTRQHSGSARLPTRGRSTLRRLPLQLPPPPRPLQLHPPRPPPPPKTTRLPEVECERGGMCWERSTLLPRKTSLCDSRQRPCDRISLIQGCLVLQFQVMFVDSQCARFLLKKHHVHSNDGGGGRASHTHSILPRRLRLLRSRLWKTMRVLQ